MAKRKAPPADDSRRLMRKSEFAKHAGLAAPRITQLIRRGMPVTADKRIDVEAATAWMEANLDPRRREIQGKAHKKPPVATALNDVKIRKELAAAERIELEVEEKRGNLVDRRQAEKIIFGRARAERDAWLAWAERAAPAIAGELGADPVQLARLLEAEVLRHLTELAATEFSLADA